MTKDMTQGSPLKLILAFAVPLMLGSLFQQFYNLADTIIVGRFVGVEALAALGATDWLYWLVLWTVQAMTQGFSVLVSQTFGSSDKKGLRKAITMSVLLCAAVVSMLRISRKDARLGARCLVYALGGAAVVCLVLGVAVKPMIGLERLGIDPPALKNLLIAYVGGLFGRFVVMAVIYFVLAAVLGVLVSKRKKHRA